MSVLLFSWQDKDLAMLGDGPLIFVGGSNTGNRLSKRNTFIAIQRGTNGKGAGRVVRVVVVVDKNGGNSRDSTHSTDS